MQVANVRHVLGYVSAGISAIMADVLRSLPQSDQGLSGTVPRLHTTAASFQIISGSPFGDCYHSIPYSTASDSGASNSYPWKTMAQGRQDSRYTLISCILY
jgi:hypothetical protein